MSTPNRPSTLVVVVCGARTDQERTVPRLMALTLSLVPTDSVSSVSGVRRISLVAILTGQILALLDGQCRTMPLRVSGTSIKVSKRSSRNGCAPWTLCVFLLGFPSFVFALSSFLSDHCRSLLPSGYTVCISGHSSNLDYWISQPRPMENDLCVHVGL